MQFWEEDFLSENPVPDGATPTMKGVETFRKQSNVNWSKLPTKR